MVTEIGDSAGDNQTPAFFSLFRLVAFSCLHDCLHVFALLACLVIHALISCFVPYLYAYLTHMPCHAIHAFDVLSVFLFTNHVTTLAHAMYMPFEVCVYCLHAIIGCFLPFLQSNLEIIRKMIVLPNG